MLYVAIFCPVFWAPAFVDRPRQLVRILAILLVCNGINSVVGVMQVYDPDRWMPRELSSVITSSRDGDGRSATYIGPNGRAHHAAAGPVRHARRGLRRGHDGGAARASSSRCEPFAWWKRGVALLFVAGRHVGDLSQPRARATWS